MRNSQVILKRIAAISVYSLLDDSKLEDAITHVRAKFYAGGSQESSLQGVAKRVDISDMDPEQVMTVIGILDVPGDEPVLVLWPSYQTGISTLYSEFVKHYDELWYPSSDDVWITDQYYTWLIIFDHEEVVTFVPPRQPKK